MVRAAGSSRNAVCMSSLIRAKGFISILFWVTGTMSVPDGRDNYPLQGFEVDSLMPIAYIHTIGAYILIAFIIIHLYLITTGRTIFSNLKAMITGWEEMDEHEAEIAVKDVIDSANQYVKESNGKKKKK